MRYLRTVFLVSLVIMALDSYSQEPIYTPMRNNYKFRGIRIDSLFMMPSFPDTTTANALDLANINGNFIRVDTSLYVRYNQKWYLINSGDGQVSVSDTAIDGANSRRWTYFNNYVAPISGAITLRNNTLPTNNPSLANNVRVSRYDETGADLNAWFTALRSYLLTNPGKAYLQLTNSFNNYIFGIYQVGTVSFTSSGGLDYWNINLTHVSSSAPTYSFLTDQTTTVSWVLFGADGSNANIDTTSLSNRINAKADTSVVNLKLNISDTANKWVNNVVSISDSAFRVIKGPTNTDITIKSVSTSVSTTKLITPVWNNTGATVPRGAVVYINGAHSSNLPTIALAKSNNEATSAYTYGLVQDSIPDNKSGIVIQNGTISNLNLPTINYTDGQTLYLSPTVAGGYTTTKPSAPNHYVAIGTVTRAHPVFGQIQVAIRNGFQLDEMSDVSIPAVPADSVLLQFSRVDSLWHDVSVTTAIGGRYLKPSDTASLSNRINARVLLSDSNIVYATRHRVDTMRTNVYGAINTKIGGGGTTGSLAEYTASGAIGNATVDVDYLQQDMSLVAMQAMGSSIKGYNIGAPVPTALAASFSMTSQLLVLCAVYIPKSVTLTGVRWFQVTNGNFTANNYNGVALYTVSGGTLTLVDSSTRDGNVWQQGTNWRNKDFVTPYSAAPGIYYIGILYSSSAQTTAPAIGTAGSQSGTYNGTSSFDFTNSQRATGTLSAQSALPTSQALSGTTTNGNKIGVYLY